MDLSIEFKRHCIEQCKKNIENKISGFLQILEELQSAAQMETKSSVGDKYETGRAMLHLEREKYASQLNTQKRLLENFNQINFHKEFPKVALGSLLLIKQTTEKDSPGQCYFFCGGLGEIEFEFEGKPLKLLCLSNSSPLGKSFSNQVVGKIVEFRNKSFKILQIL